MRTRAKVEFGDFQTPLPLAQEVCELVAGLTVEPDVIVEPTAGRGVFLLAASASFPKARLRGWDINPDYVNEAKSSLNQAGAGSRSTLEVQDFFTHDWETVFADAKGRILILGNPPWVTNSGLAAINGSNLPVKENFMGLRGLAARTGKANFDISEWMLIRLLHALKHRPATLAMLCKTSTARKFLRYAWRNDGRIADASLYHIDASAHFDATVDACLLFLRTGSGGKTEAHVYPSLDNSKPIRTLGLSGSDLVADMDAYRRYQHLEGLSPFQWRSGIKHDCASVMELRAIGAGSFANGLGETIPLESDFLYPLLKCSDLSNSRLIPQRTVIVTQGFVGDDTSQISEKAPLTWRYLQTHADRFLARKSSIYKSTAPFALFGIGPYAFASWKVAVSGLHRTARFQIIPPHEGRPVFFDDTCYYLSFQTEKQARLVGAILNSTPSQQFLAALIFPDSKRPITSDLLHRLNLSAIAKECRLEKEWQDMPRTQQTKPAAEEQLALAMETPRRYLRKKAADTTPAT